ncbi:hypothetical protein DPT59_23395 [Salmonella enterica subsp. enterica serovar Stanleyville]|nr:hypothetical protein [Salmonella enterica subsp. enterica serovar Stanleyville]EBZ5787703.1 hypothetical protein [Salmonella enterica subsp. enterica serovar Lawndale]EDF9815712.1 hypothetical protein [Salmonella enterica subsp. enterica serovar Tennessee]EDU6114161.1 hypothetical protein [Salmonella enterica subsp. enterica serovar Splott]EBS3860231.1 hypothetical protein [Salmonella enterica subsp. enterica serovar Stanleyville]
MCKISFMFFCFHNPTKTQRLQKISALVGCYFKFINCSDFFNNRGQFFTLFSFSNYFYNFIEY